MRACVRACVRACARACVRACVCVCVKTYLIELTYAFLLQVDSQCSASSAISSKSHKRDFGPESSVWLAESCVGL